MAKMIIRCLLLLLGIICTCVFMIPVFHTILNAGNIAGILLGFVLILTSIFYDKLGEIVKNAYGHIFSRIILLVICVIIVSIIGTAGYLSIKMTDAIADTSYKSDVVIILGCKVNGNTPSKMLRGRLDAAIKYHKKNPDAYIICTGGQGYNETRTEASAMKEYLINKGISENLIIEENKSTSTQENIEFSFNIIKNNNYGDNITIVTDNYHQYRARLFAGKYFNNIHSCSSNPDWYFTPTYWVREWFGILRYKTLK